MTIKPYPQNAKKHPDKQLKQIAASIERFGFRQPIVIDKDGTIIVGHGRYEAATKILEWTELKEASEAKKGEKLIPYIIADDLTEDEIKAYRLADNKLNESGWDMGIVELELNGLDTELAKLTGFDITGEVQEDNFDAGSAAENIHNVEQGDVYELGGHRLMCGDSTHIQEVEVLLDGEKANMVFTDPPYGISYKSNYANRDGSENVHRRLLSDAMPQDLLGVLAIMDCPVYVCTRWDVAGQWITFLSNYKYKVKNAIVWVKSNHTMGDLQGAYGSKWELILFAHKGDFKFKTKRDVDVWDLGQIFTSGHRHHPTEKTIKVPSRAISNHPDAEVILDPFAGSGSTLMACEQLKRKCYTMELDPHYCSVIIERWQQFTNKKAIKL